MTGGDNAFLGTWKLRSLVREDVETGNKSYPLGTSPTGYLNYSADGRMMVILVGDSRKAPAGPVATDAEMIALFKSMMAYAGTYTIDGNQVIHRVDASSGQSTTGTKLIRFFTLSDGLLTLTTAPGPNRWDGRMSVATLVWEKMGSSASTER